MTANQILIGIGLILVLAVGAQVLASRLHIPAIIVLLPTGFVAGALTTDVNPDKLLGPAFDPAGVGVWLADCVDGRVYRLAPPAAQPRGGRSLYRRGDPVR